MDKEKKAKESNLIVDMDVYLRILLGTMFPDRCSIEEYLTFDDIKKKIQIDEEEAKEVGLKVLSDGRTSTWNPKGNEMKEFHFTPKEVKVIVDICELASRNKNFPNNPKFFDFYKKLKDFRDAQKEK